MENLGVEQIAGGWGVEGGGMRVVWVVGFFSFLEKINKSGK